MENEKDIGDIVREELKKLSQEQKDNQTQIRYDKSSMSFQNSVDYARADAKEGIYKSMFSKIVEQEFPNIDIGEVREKMFLAPVSMPKEIADIPEDRLLAFYDKYRAYIWTYLQKAGKETYDSVTDYLHDIEIMKNVSTEVQFVTALARLAIAHGIITSELRKKKSKQYSCDDPFADMKGYYDSDDTDDDEINF